MNFLINNILYPLYVLCCFVFAIVCADLNYSSKYMYKLATYHYYFSVILGSQCSPILFSFLIMYLFN